MSAVARQAFVGAGANLGDRAATLRSAVARLRAWPGVAFVAESGLFETEPVGVVDQPMFLNLAVGLETTLTPEELLTALLAIEQEFGRVRTQRWGPRTLDLDLLAFEGETRASEALQLPHPRMFERSFVLAPLREVVALPRFQRPVWAELRRRVDAKRDEGVRRVS